MYYISYGNTKWVKTRATTIDGAKRAARKNCIFQGQDLWVAIGDAEGPETVVAKRLADPIDMNRAWPWQECCEPLHETARDWEEDY